MKQRKQSLTNFDHLPRQWERWLRAEFGGSPTFIARSLGVSRQTADKWLNGAEPRGRHLAAALIRYPAARAAILGETT